MESIETAQADPPTFRRSWWGYDRQEVEDFLRQTAADRQRHQESLAWLEALMAGYDQEAREAAMAAVRRESHQARIAALRRNAGRLAKAEPGPSRTHSIVALARTGWVTLRSISRPQAYALLAAALVCVSLLAISGSDWGTAEVQATQAPAGNQDVAQFKVNASVPAATVPDARPADMPGPAVEQMPAASPSPVAAPLPVPAPPPVAALDGLVITVTATRSCWIGTTIDGGQRLERILKPDETVMLHAHDEVLLRVGDAAAISVLINNQPMKPLGGSGQVVTRRISRSNYSSLLTP
jgi:Domain of unknown function (DUF4115)